MFGVQATTIIFGIAVTVSLTFAQIPRGGEPRDSEENVGQETSCSYTINVPKSSEGGSCSSFLEVSWDLHDLRGQNEQLQGQVQSLQDQYSELLVELQDIKRSLIRDQGDEEVGGCRTTYLTKDHTDREPLSNGDFENDGSWTGYRRRAFSFTTDEAYTGSRSIVVTLDEADQVGGASQRLVFERNHPSNMVVKGWSKAVNVVGDKDAHYSIYCDVITPPGTPRWGFNTPFDVGTHDWQEVTVDIDVPEGIAAVTCYALFRYKVGTVYFDNFSAKISTCKVHCKCG